MKRKILLVGASTGGPRQIKEMLQSIETLSCTVIIAQHMQEKVLPYFIHDLQESLPTKVFSTPLQTDFREPSIIVCSNTVAIRSKANTFEIYNHPQGQSYTPDINILFNSFADFTHEFDIDVLILSGIGSDGVDGAQLLESKGANIFAEDEESSAVYGMPKVAFERGIVKQVKSLSEIKSYFQGL